MKQIDRNELGYKPYPNTIKSVENVNTIISNYKNNYVDKNSNDDNNKNDVARTTTKTSRKERVAATTPLKNTDFNRATTTARTKRIIAATQQK